MLSDESSVVHESRDIRENRTIESSGEATGHVASVVGCGNQEGVRRTVTRGQCFDGARHRHTGQGARQIADVIERGRPVLTGHPGEGTTLTPGDGLDGAGQRTRVT